ncbi:MAG: tetratricopeptide repeat protein [Candidatus Thorarchaeota archaeon]
MDDTLRAVKKHLEENPDDASAWNVRGVLLANKNEFGEALRCLNRAIRLDPNLSEAHINRGRVLMALGPDKASRALESFDKALRLSPDNWDALIDKAKALRALGRTKEELACYEKVSETVTDVPAIWIRMGDIKLEQGHFNDAVINYDQALMLDPEKVTALVHRAIGLSMMEKGKEAVKSAEKATKLAPDDIETWRVLADVNIRYGKQRAAMKALKKASEIDPSDASVENTMGMVEFKAGRLKDAAAHFRRALVRDKKHTTALRNLGFVQMDLEEWSEASRTWDRLTAIVQDDPQVFDAKATTYARLEDFCSASEAWERARKLYKKRSDDREANRVAELKRAARINCSRQKKAARAEREREKATRSFSDRFDERRRKPKKKR